MNAVDTSAAIVIGPNVVLRSDVYRPDDEHTILASFHSYAEAVIAIRLLRRPNWQDHADLTLEDDAALTLSVLVRRLAKLKTGSDPAVKPSRDQRVFQPEKEEFMRATSPALSIGDLL